MSKKVDILISSPLLAISSLDGRYHKKTKELEEFVSEFALMKARVEVEVNYLIHLSQKKILRKISKNEKKILVSLFKNFSYKDGEQVKELEEETRHDVKAIERFMRNKLKNTSLKDIIEFLHFGLTSEDTNNIAYRLMLKRGMQGIVIPCLEKIESEIEEIVKKYKSLPMLARTHGQNAVPTTLGKEFAVFLKRINKELTVLKKQNLTGKLNGAVGNFNALHYVYPKIDWVSFSDKFVSSFRLEPNLITTQINTYEDITSYLQTVQRINTILIDFNQDMWRYISDNYFCQKFKKNEVGSSTMPQKVNPIDFENSEGNLGLANSIIEFMVRKLPISRLQRDLTDSTVIRNIGVVLGYELVAAKSLLTGLSRIEVNKNVLTDALLSDWSILTEGVQTYLRSIGVKDPYVLIASLSKGKKISENEWAVWIAGLPIEEAHKTYLKKLTPFSYLGISEKIAILSLKEKKL